MQRIKVLSQIIDLCTNISPQTSFFLLLFSCGLGRGFWWLVGLYLFFCFSLSWFWGVFFFLFFLFFFGGEGLGHLFGFVGGGAFLWVGVLLCFCFWCLGGVLFFCGWPSGVFCFLGVVGGVWCGGWGGFWGFGGWGCFLRAIRFLAVLFWGFGGLGFCCGVLLGSFLPLFFFFFWLGGVFLFIFFGVFRVVFCCFRAWLGGFWGVFVFVGAFLCVVWSFAIGGGVFWIGSWFLGLFFSVGGGGKFLFRVGGFWADLSCVFCGGFFGGTVLVSPVWGGIFFVAVAGFCLIWGFVRGFFERGCLGGGVAFFFWGLAAAWGWFFLFWWVLFFFGVGRCFFGGCCLCFSGSRAANPGSC